MELIPFLVGLLIGGAWGLFGGAVLAEKTKLYRGRLHLAYFRGTLDGAYREMQFEDLYPNPWGDSE